MATTQILRDKLSDEIGDYWVSTTTSDSASVNEIIDDALKQFDDDEFIDKFNTSIFLTGETFENQATSKSGNTVQFRGDFDGNPSNTTAYSLHRIFTFTDKDRTITRMATSIFPIWLMQTRKTWVVNQPDGVKVSSRTYE